MNEVRMQDFIIKANLKINTYYLIKMQTEGYFQVYPFSRMDSARVKNLGSEVPNKLVFSPTNQFRFKVLVQDYHNQFGRKIQGFQLRDGTFFGNQKSLDDLKKWLGTEKIDGTCFFIVQHFKSCIVEVVQNLNLKHQDAKRIHFEIAPSNYSVYIDWYSDEIDELRYKLVMEIDKIWQKSIKPDSIHFQNQQGLYNLSESQKMGVKIDGIELCWPNKNNVFLTIKGTKDIILESTRFQKSQIAGKNVCELLKKIDNSQDWKQFGLKIGNTVIKSNQLIESKFKPLFQSPHTSISNLVGVVVRQVHIFQAQRSKIEEKSTFDLQSILVATQHQQFKGNFKNVDPILLCASRLIVRPSTIGKRQSSLFRVVNEHMRTQNFAATSQQDYLKWQYRFQCLLLNKLSELPPLQPYPKQPNAQNLQEGWTNRVLWRGQSYLHHFQVNQIVKFKQFISTTERESVAKGLASACLLKIIKSKSGRLIQDYSIFKTEAEVLFTTYTSFRVLRKYIISNQKKNKDMICFQMEQIEVLPPPLPHANFVLWVDDKTVEGKKVWDQFSSFEHSTILKQLVSTQQLQKWLQTNKQTFKNPKEIINISMISNMTRKENGKDNGFAGVDAIKVFTKYLPNSNMFLYIGNRKLALQKLQKNNIYPSDQLRVSSIPQQLKNFLKNNIKIL